MAGEVTRASRGRRPIGVLASTERSTSPLARARCTSGDRLGTVRACSGVAGTCGSLACMASMVLALVGVAGAGIASGARVGGGSMAGMAGTGPAPAARAAASRGAAAPSHPGGVLGFLVTIGPELLVVSILLVTVNLALRRRVAALPALFAGALLYWGMYAQGSDALMYATIAVGYTIWAATYAWTRLRTRASKATWPALR
ncbi:MAG: hypothetical protein M0Z42_09680 [Actinomycetota bacterium]|nr:hypothetical protein [Actinomycetota bacterium]